MKVLLTMLACVMVAVPSVAGQSDVQSPLRSFIGIWHVDSTDNNTSATSPFLLNIRVAGEELTIERRAATATTTETSHYRLDGQSARTVQGGRPADATVTIEGTTLVIKSKLALPGGKSSTVIESYTVGRSMMMVDRTTTVGAKTTTASEMYQFIPDNQDLHGGVELR